MASAAVIQPHPHSPGNPGHSPVKTTDILLTASSSTPSIRPPSPSAPPTMFSTTTSGYERRDSEQSETDDNARSQSQPITRPISPAPKHRTSSTGNIHSFLSSATGILSPPSFHPTNRNSSPESRRTRSSENIPTIGSSPESSPQQHHSSLGGTPYHNGQTMSMRHPDHHLYANQDYEALMRPKKRHKTSRACDECRRKKIRCDATSEANVEQCSSCKRAGVNCSFSRVPMKRGPTKGLEAQYIRELEDRLVSLEYSVQTKAHPTGREHSPPSRRHVEYPNNNVTPPQVFKQPHPHQNEPVKLNPVLNSHPRNQVDRLPPIEAIHASPPVTNEKRHAPEYFRQPFHPTTHRHDPLPSTHHYQNHEQHALDRRNSVDQSRKLPFPGHALHERSSSFNDAIGRRPSNLNLLENSTPSNGTIAIDDSAINRYYEIYHQALPVLPHSIKRLHGYLSAAPLHLRNALLHAIYALTANDQGPLTPASPRSQQPLPSHIDHTLKACDLIGVESFVSDNANASGLSRNLLHMQILLLLALNADKRAFAPPIDSPRPSMALGHPLTEHGYTTRFVGSMMGAAWGCANEMKLHEIKLSEITRKRSRDHIEQPDQITDIDGEECLSRRAWWILVILDRWRAVATSSMPLIGDDKIYLKDSDRHVLGEVGYHLVRVSCVLGHISEIPNSSGDATLNLVQIARLLNGECERVRETAEMALSRDALLNVAFLHTKLLIVSHTTDIYQSHGNVYHALLTAVKKVVDLLLSRKFNPFTPLVHHIIGFTTVVLVRLSNLIDTREEARRMLHDLLGDRKLSQFDPERNSLLDGYDVIAKKFLEHSGRRHSELPPSSLHRRDSESHYNDSNGHGRLAHLAELAVGEGSDRDFGDRYIKPKVEAWRSIGGEEGLDGLVKRHGYLSALQNLLSH